LEIKQLLGILFEMLLQMKLTIVDFIITINDWGLLTIIDLFIFINWWLWFC